MAQGFQPGAAALHMASGGAFGFIKSLVSPKPQSPKTPEEKPQTPPQQAVPAPNTIAGYAGMTAMQRREKEAGLKQGGDLQTGKGGHVPGTGQGDKIPAKYEPGEFVVSNAMLEANPGLREQLHAARDAVLAAQGTTPAQADAKNAGVIAKLAAKTRADQPSLGFAAGGAIDDEARKRNSFGDGAAAMSNSGVSQVPTGLPKAGPIASLGAAAPASPAAPLAQGPIAGLNSRSVSSAIAPGAGQGITGNNFGDASAATSNPAVQQPTVGGGLIRYAANYGPAGLNPAARVEGSTSVPTPGDSAEPVAPGLGFGKLSTPPSPPESMAGAGRGIAPDPRSLGNPGTIADQAKGLSAAPPVAAPGPIASLNNPKALNNVVGSAVDGAPGVVKLQGGMFKNPMYTDDPVRAANQFNQIGLVPGASTGAPASGTAGGSSSAPKLGFGASASTDAALSAARFAAADRGDFSAIRDTYNAHGQSFGGETKESVAADRLKELALSPRGTPGRRAAMQMMTENTAAQTARYAADSQVRSQQAANGIAQRRLGLEEQKAAADDAQKARVAQLDNLILNGNPMQQKMAAGQKAALLGKGTAPASPPSQPERSMLGQVGHNLGLAGRAAVNAVAAPVALVADAVAAPVNAGLALYDKVREPTAQEQASGVKQNGFRFPDQAQALNTVMDTAGVAKPENSVERVAQDVAAGAGAAMTGMGIGGVLAKSAGPLSRAVGAMLTQGPTMQVASGAASGGAMGLTREGGGGAVAQGVAGLAGAVLPGAASAPFRSVVDPARRQIAASAQQAHEAGYVIPPADLTSGPGTQLASAISGKVKTSQEASFRNQSKSNDMARKALGMTPEQNLDADTLATIRKDAAKAYEPVAGAGVVVPGQAYADALDDAVSVFSSQSKSFPGMPVPPVVGHIEALKTMQFDSGDALNAIKVLRGAADTAYRSGDKLVGSAYKKAAGAMEGAIEDHLMSLGEPAADILKQYRDARQLIAKTYTVQGALNETTGNVNAIKLAADLKKGKPLTGELRTVAEAGQAFPKAMQNLKEAPGKNSVLDVVTALGATTATGNPLGMAGLVARPTLRSVLLSKKAQSKYVREAGLSPAGETKGAPAIAVETAARVPTGEDPRDSSRPKVFKNRLQAGHAARLAGGSVVRVEGGFVVQPQR